MKPNPEPEPDAEPDTEVEFVALLLEILSAAAEQTQDSVFLLSKQVKDMDKEQKSSNRKALFFAVLGGVLGLIQVVEGGLALLKR
jgi:hypothetical protein